MCLPKNIVQHIIVDPLANESTKLSVQQISLFICFIIRLYIGKYWFVKVLDIKRIFHFPLPNGIINNIQSNHSSCDESRWVMDTGAASHVTSRKNFFSSYTSGDSRNLSMGNETICRVVGIGKICLKNTVETKLVLNNVKDAPNVCRHLISVGVLDNEGYVNTNSDGKWTLIRGSLVVTEIQDLGSDKLGNSKTYQEGRGI